MDIAHRGDYDGQTLSLYLHLSLAANDSTGQMLIRKSGPNPDSYELSWAINETLNWCVYTSGGTVYGGPGVQLKNHADEWNGIGMVANEGGTVPVYVFYEDGSVAEDATPDDMAGATLNTNANNMLRLICNGTGDRVALFGLWNRALLREEVRQLYRDPFAMFRPRSRVYAAPAGAPSTYPDWQPLGQYRATPRHTTTVGIP